MNLELIGNLIRLRYKLLWAKTRTRNGRIALFVVGYLLLVLLLVLLAGGGFGAGMAAVRSGRAEKIAQAVLSGLYLNAIVSAIILGLGTNALFAENQLRRYPLNALERLVARHFIGIVDPYWFLFLALELGLAVGLYVFGAGSFPAGATAALLLFVSNYLAARIVALLVERVVVRKSGSFVLMAAILALSMLPAAIEPVVKKNPHAFDGVLLVLSITPPFGAAAAMTRSGMNMLSGLGLVVCWVLGLGAVLMALERRPPRTRTVQRASIRWDNRYDRVGAFFGPRYGPFITHWLRFYARNNRFRTVYTLALPLAAFLTMVWARQHGEKMRFAAALSAFGVLGCMGTLQFAVNQFGHSAGGFRRLLLLPADAGVVMRAGSYTFLLLSSTLIAAGTILFGLFSPFPYDARMLAMLVSAAATALFLLHGLGLWSSLLGARRADYYSSFGNDLSVVGNIVVVGGALGAMLLPMVLSQKWPAALTADKWWVFCALAVLSAAFYFVSLERAGGMLKRRREQLLAIVDGRG